MAPSADIGDTSSHLVPKTQHVPNGDDQREEQSDAGRVREAVPPLVEEVAEEPAREQVARDQRPDGDHSQEVARDELDVPGCVRRVAQVIEKEEENFFGTIDAGLAHIERVFGTMQSAGRTVVRGEDAARLYQTYGVPPELFEQMAAEASAESGQAQAVKAVGRAFIERLNADGGLAQGADESPVAFEQVAPAWMPSARKA